MSDPFKKSVLQYRQNYDSENSAYTGSHNLYKVFSKFLDKVVNDYHKPGLDAKQSQNVRFKA